MRKFKGLRSAFWDSLTSVHLHWSVPWSFGGDFNMTRFSHEKRESGILTHSMRRFSDFVERDNFVDLPLAGAKNTWYNNQEGGHEQD